MQLKHLLLGFLFSLFLLESHSQRLEIKVLKEYPIPNTSIRAIQVVNDSTLWFTGSNGKIGKIMDGELRLDSISYQGKKLNFRSIAFNGKYLFVLSIENPAVLYKIHPFAENREAPKIVYQEKHKQVFYDAMSFFDEQHGIAMGDPTASSLSVILTKNGGETWEKLQDDRLPVLDQGEAAFAASNTNIAIIDKNAWLVTGGNNARVFYTHDLGKNWRVSQTPVIHGEKMSGIFSVDFYDKDNGIIMGGNWEKKSNTQATKAITENGGKTWKLIAENEIPGYISCVQYIPNTKGKKIMAVSTEGIYFSNNQGQTWHKISDNGYYSIRFVDKNTAWLSGNNKIAKIKLQYK